MCAQIPFTICATWRAQINMRKLMCSSFSAKLNYDLRSPATICAKHLTQTEVEICADVSMCREVSANYLRRRVGADSIYILRYLQAQTNVRKPICRLVGANLNHDLRRAVAICIKHLMQTEVEIRAQTTRTERQPHTLLTPCPSWHAQTNVCKPMHIDRCAQT